MRAPWHIFPADDATSFLTLETTGAARGRSVAQHVFDVVFQAATPRKSAALRTLPAWSKQPAFLFCSTTERRVCQTLKSAAFPQWPAAAIWGSTLSHLVINLLRNSAKDTRGLARQGTTPWGGPILRDMAPHSR